MAWDFILLGFTDVRSRSQVLSNQFDVTTSHSPHIEMSGGCGFSDSCTVVPHPSTKASAINKKNRLDFLPRATLPLPVLNLSPTMDRAWTHPPSEFHQAFLNARPITQ